MYNEGRRTSLTHIQLLVRNGLHVLPSCLPSCPLSLLPAPWAPSLVSQVFCSALPVAYSALPDEAWAKFACCVLEGAYEATLAVAALAAAQRQRRVSVFLTKLGGGAFGNSPDWIFSGIERALKRYRHAPLDVRLVSYRDDPGARAAALEQAYPIQS